MTSREEDPADGQIRGPYTAAAASARVRLRLRASKDASKGVRRLVEKRPPQITGR